MAKRSVLTHTKFKKLCRKLCVPEYAALGILESLWHLTARECPRGDIGKLSDEDIAIAIGWEKGESDLISALVECGWVDPDPEFRLIIHDWHDHADDATKKAIVRSRREFVGTCRDNGVNCPPPDAVVQGCTEVSGNVATSPDMSRLPEPEPEPETDAIASGASAPDPDAPVPEVSPPRPRQPAENAYPVAEAVLTQVHRELGWDDPIRKDILRRLKPDDPVQILAAQYGVDQAAAMFVFACRSWKGKVSWEAVFDKRFMIADQMQAPSEPVPARSNGQRRPLLEPDEFSEAGL